MNKYRSRRAACDRKMAFVRSGKWLNFVHIVRYHLNIILPISNILSPESQAVRLLFERRIIHQTES